MIRSLALLLCVVSLSGCAGRVVTERIGGPTVKATLPDKAKDSPAPPP